jgi:micrococcal nuclease
MKKETKIKIIVIFLIILVCGTLAYISTPKKQFKLKPPKINPDEKYLVTNVLDGDTFEIKIGKSIWKVRMLGIDTPETLDPRKGVECFGHEASDKTKEILSNKQIGLDLDSSQEEIDKFNRLLAYVYLDHQFINKYLLENGFAREYTYNKAYKFQKDFKKAEKEAKNNKIGLWKSCG